MSLTDRLRDDVKTAMRARDKARLGTLRMAMAAIKQREVDERTTLDDTAVLAVLEKMIKQRRESIAQYESGRRQDLADRERAEIEVLAGYLPARLSETEVAELIDRIIAETGASTVRDMGKVMGEIKARAAGRIDMGAVNAQVRQRLSG